MRIFLSIVFATVAALGFTQAGISGEGQYTSQRGISGLTAGGFGVLPDGRVSPRGAVAFSTPIGFTLGHRSLVIGASNLSYGRSLRFFEVLPGVGDTNPDANGSAIGVLGLTGSSGNFAVGCLMTTGDLDTSLTLQWSPSRSFSGWGVSVGVQDAFSTAAANTGPIADTIGPGNSRSFFVAASKEFGPLWVTGGLGTERFKKAFASASLPLGRSNNVFAEFDGFGTNVGFVSQTRALLGFEANTALVLVRGDYLTWSATVRF